MVPCHLVKNKIGEAQASWKITREILKSHKKLEVLTEIMFVNNLSFLASTRKGLKFTTIEYISNKSEISLINSINIIGNYYKSHG